MYDFFKALRFLAKIFLILMGFYLLQRMLFFVYFSDILIHANIGVVEIGETFLHAIALDAATVSYILLLPWCLITLYLICKQAFLITAIRWGVGSIMLLSILLSIAELGVYGEWGEKPGIEVFTYLHHPDEIINSNPMWATVLLSFILIILTYFSFKFIKSSIVFELHAKSSWLASAGFFLTTFVVLLIVGRGGIGSVPITQSDAYFSRHKILNDAAVNTSYNFFHAVVWNQSILDGNNPYASSLSRSEKKHILPQLIQSPSSTKFPRVLTTERPNIVLVILESWSGDFIGPNADYKGVTPYFHEMASEGILFSQTYGSGTLSHEGLPAILSAWPAISGLYITNIPSKVNQLPSITKSLSGEGYETMFLYGGQLRYGNMTSYIYANHFDYLFEEKNFPSDTPRGPLGVHDEFAYSKFTKHINQLKEPFFASMFTASSHSPYVQPMKDEILWGGYHQPYLNSVLYSDQTIKTFMQNMKKEPFYDQTLFIFIADHSHITPNNYNRNQPDWHHIPMLFYGEVIKKEFQGSRVNKIISQHDLASTLLAQMDVNHDSFQWSRNIFKEDYAENAYYVVHNGYGFITPHGNYAFSVKDKRVLVNTLPKEHEKEKLFGEVYTDHLMQSILQ